MALPGPPKKPTALRLLEGNRGHAKISPFEPKPRQEIPPPPAGLDALALEEWGRLSVELQKLGLLTIIDAPALAAYCQAFARWRKAEEALAEMAKANPQSGALMIVTKSGNLIQNPLVGTARRAMADMVRYATEFGMTPAARARLVTTQGGDEGSPLLQHLLG